MRCRIHLTSKGIHEKKDPLYTRSPRAAAGTAGRFGRFAQIAVAIRSSQLGFTVQAVERGALELFSPVNPFIFLSILT